MLTADQEERLAARWLGEAFREIAILVLVFVPLDWFLGERDYKATVTSTAVSVSELIFVAGTRLGYHGERVGSYGGDEKQDE